MTRSVAFLRAVNLGKRKVPMAQLRDEFEALGFADVSTYVNSGNVIFSAQGKAADLEKKIEARLEQAFGFEIPTFVRTAKEVVATSAHKPFGTVAAGDTHMVAFLRTRPTAAVKKAITELSNDVDELILHGRDIHWLIHGKVMDSTIGQKGWKNLGAETTARATTMLAKLVAKLDDR